MSTKEANDSKSAECECPTCGEEFKNPHGMRIHHHQKHGFSVSPEDGSGPECPTCGRADFSNETGMKQHHAKSHDESIAGVEVECAWCGKTKRVPPVETEDHDRHFCDSQCQGAWKAENIVGENHPLRDRAGVWCSWCGSIKAVKRYQYELYDRFFCNPGCKGEWMDENREDENGLAWDGGKTTIRCANCDETVERWPSKIERAERSFCGSACAYEWISKNLSGSNHPLWEGGPSRYGEGWTYRLKEKIRDRQGRLCGGCGTHESEFRQRLDVHHIQKARSFDDDQKRNDDSILVALCPTCHPAWESMTPLRPQTPHLD